ncbi:probable betaine-aldehyde dehydrogenase (plasmid) [Rhodococcus jostii RHA1]|jgi:betaine-aldehyde dehydrogenase|uniref:aldehyde dehydrogenase (NAD(+)) n=4 Tax=Rhodococcus TaxID=1827 RepID=A0A1H4LPQ7_9NOCA|nr:MULTISPECIES: aldehyde dehydrogenase [Rhodococcus]ABG99252.1 probable betaine-aldehyde dehydrogenase [Rhodococcus jostii RHA1]EID80169.1 betaine-aldehyde dehydrogenase [Rhodococcus opacus RKJ300 = JCM 13270]QQZ18509.1 aldehyde dehydrogenase [Rhodococcus sp. 21391]SEB72769.1 betaine-aldehyde dehydrogenase [Rhodococcus koreensis]GCE44701.1 Aldehyde dehydrogenase [Rhodococcus wratislaviensis]
MNVPHANELFIGSRWVAPQGSELADVVAPFGGRVIRQLPRPTVDDAKLAVAQAQEAFGAWADLTHDARGEIVTRFCGALDKRLDEIVRVWALEAGMPFRNGDELTKAASDLWNRALDESRTAPWIETRETSMGRIEVRQEPIGPTVGIVAFNGPHMQFALAIIPGLLAGNTMIIKLPPECRMLGYLFADAAAEADFPPGVLSILAGDADVSQYLVEHPGIAAVHFTGGTEVGMSVMHACADRVANLVLELGGKSAAIVAADADLDLAVPALVDAMALYSGQICVAMTRLLVAREIHDEVVDRLVAGLEALTMGDPANLDTTWGPLAAPRFLDRAENYIERAVAGGATIATGGARPSGLEGYFLEPTLLTNVNNDMEAAQNEIFGPVFCVIPFDNLDEAVAIANDSRYGLSGSVFTTDEQAGLDVARRVRSGVFIINGTFPCLAAPFGGVKQSGFGREGGPEGLFALTQTKSITLSVAAGATA